MAAGPVDKGYLNVMCSSYDGFLRVSEVFAPSDLEFDPSVQLKAADAPSYVAVNIKASKTDPFRRRVTIYLGRIHGTICPVVATLKYMVERSLLK